MKKTYSVNDTGYCVEDEGCRLQKLHFYEEGGSVLVWAKTKNSKGDEEEGLQYLTPEEAMKFAGAMEACAIQALKKQK